MTRDGESGHERRARNEPPQGWEHIPNDELEIVSPSYCVSPLSTAYDPSQIQPKSDQDRHNSDDVPAVSGKEAEHRYDEVFDTTTRLKKRRFLSEWWQEMLSALSSVLCLVAIIVILYKVNGKPLSEWNEPVSLNAVISVLSTAGKAGLILPVAECISQLKWIYLQGSSKSKLEQLQTFDSASRGPAGSLQFFFQARGVPLISYFACLIVILALALDPFTQQIIQYHQSFDTPVPHLNSTVRHSQAYDRGSGSAGASYSVMTNNDAVLSGMVSGLYGNLPVPPFTCPGGNCTYPEVTSVGMCSTCEDVTERTVVNCTVPWGSGQYGRVLNTCNYTLPGGTNLNATAQNMTSPTSTKLTLKYPTLEMSAEDRGPSYMGSNFYNRTIEATLYNLDFVRFDSFNNPGGDGTEWQDTMSAHQCAFELCAWSFQNWSHLDSALQEGSVAQSKLVPPEALVEKSTGSQRPETFEASDPGFPGNHTFEVSWNDRVTIITMFEMMWSDNAAYGGEGTKHFRNSLYLASPDIPRTFDNISRSVTYNMMDGPNSTVSLGQVFKTETFIRVRWEWLTLSIITIISSVALLAATIVKTCTMEQRAWKSSLIPLLYADLTNSGGDSGMVDRLQRKAAISTGLLAASTVGTGTALSR